jgi:hypothetical protein
VAPCFGKFADNALARPAALGVVAAADACGAKLPLEFEVRAQGKPVPLLANCLEPLLLSCIDLRQI